MHLKTKNKSSIKGLRSLLLTGAAALTLALTACGGSQAASPDDGRYKTVATVGMVADIVRNVAGDKTEVVGLIGEGVDPHGYKPTRGDVMELRNADIVFYGGLMLEGKMGDVLARIARQGKPIHAISEKIVERGYYVMSGERTEDRTEFDPHLWMDMGAWIEGVDVVAESLAEFDPKNADYYRKNADSYMETLQEVEEYVEKVLSTIPEHQRFLVTAHDAFYYMGRAYDI
ncbi:MAG TPA: zinc ABC transporter substrate-binding protein, partial [Opitutales bacterium]|nr:zinc ABC transporter substrate-binding protein [Opitutales bacterium]